jgi:hypothetical protein
MRRMVVNTLEGKGYFLLLLLEESCFGVFTFNANAKVSEGVEVPDCERCPGYVSGRMC